MSLGIAGVSVRPTTDLYRKHPAGARTCVGELALPRHSPLERAWDGHARNRAGVGCSEYVGRQDLRTAAHLQRVSCR